MDEQALLVEDAKEMNEHRVLDQMLNDAIRLTNDNMGKFEHVIDLFAADLDADILVGDGEKSEFEDKDQVGFVGGGISLNEDIVATQAIKMEMIRKGYSNKDQKKRSANGSDSVRNCEEFSFDREKEQILEICDDLSKEFCQMANALQSIVE